MIKFILTTIAIIFLIRLVAPFIFRWLLGAFVKKSMRNGTFFYSNINQQRQQQSQANGYGSNGQSNKKGDVRIDYIPEQQERKGFDGGKYVDYEEVK